MQFSYIKALKLSSLENECHYLFTLKYYKIKINKYIYK